MAGKPRLTSPVTSSEFDEFPGSKAEREINAYRRDLNYHRGTALAVVGGDGESISARSEATLEDVLYELRALRVAMMFAGTAADIGDGVETLV